MTTRETRPTQETRILALLQASWPEWVPAPTLAAVSLQYAARIHALRKRGWLIANRIETKNGIKRGFYRLGPRPIPPSSELRPAKRAPMPAPMLFDPPEGHRDDG